jgi:hypothetical protein
MLESLTAEELTNAAAQAEAHEPISDPRIRELLKMISRIGATAPGSDEKKSYLLAQLKSSMVYYGCPFIFFTINPGERHSPIALYYAGEEIDINMIRTVIQTCFKGGMFGELAHHYGTIEYQGRFTPHIHMAVIPLLAIRSY